MQVELVAEGIGPNKQGVKPGIGQARFPNGDLVYVFAEFGGKFLLGPATFNADFSEEFNDRGSLEAPLDFLLSVAGLRGYLA